MKMMLIIRMMMIAMMMMTMTTKLLRSRWFCQEKYFLLNTFDQQPPRRKGAEQINIKKWSSGKQQVRYQKYEKELGAKFIGRKRSLSFLSSDFVIFVFYGECGCILCIGLLLLHYPLAGPTARPVLLLNNWTVKRGVNFTVWSTLWTSHWELGRALVEGNQGEERSSQWTIL